MTLWAHPRSFSTYSRHALGQSNLQGSPLLGKRCYSGAEDRPILEGSPVFALRRWDSFAGDEFLDDDSVMASAGCEPFGKAHEAPPMSLPLVRGMDRQAIDFEIAVQFADSHYSDRTVVEVQEEHFGPEDRIGGFPVFTDELSVPPREVAWPRPVESITVEMR